MSDSHGILYRPFRCLFPALTACTLVAALVAAPAFAQGGGADHDDFANGFNDFMPDVESRPLDDLLGELAPFSAPDTPTASTPTQTTAPDATPPAPQFPPALARWVVQERAGLAIEIPENMTMQWDDHDIVLFSDGRAFEDTDGLYAALFLGEADEFERLNDGAIWAERSRDSIDLPGAGRFHRMMLRLNPDHGEGSGQVLMSEAPGADGRHRLAFVLAANRPESGPEVARILGSFSAADPASPNAFGPPPPETPEGWTRQVRLGLSFAVPPGFAPFELDPEILILVRGLDAEALMTQGPSPDLDGTMITVSRLSQQDIASPDMPVIARDTLTLADGQVFHRVEAAETAEGMTVRGHILHSDLRDRAERAIGLGIIAFNPADQGAFRAEAEAIIATMRLHPSPHFETPATEAQIMGGLFDVHLPRGWRIYMRRTEQVLILTPSGFVALTTGDPARFALTLDSHDGTPPITDGSFLGRDARIAEGRAAPQALAGGGVVTTIALDTCLGNGDPIAIAIASNRTWQGIEDYTAFIAALRLNLPHDAIPCRPAMGEEATATDQTAAPPAPFVPPAPAAPAAPTPAPPAPLPAPLPAPSPPAASPAPDATPVTKPPVTAAPPAPAVPEPHAASVAPSPDAMGWTTHRGARFGTLLPYPSAVFSAVPPLEEDWHRFTSADAAATITVLARRNLFGQEMTAILAETLGGGHFDSLTHFFHESGRIHVEGARGDRHVVRLIVRDAANVDHHLHLEYPLDQAVRYAGHTRHMVEGFASGDGTVLPPLPPAPPPVPASAPTPAPSATEPWPADLPTAAPAQTPADWRALAGTWRITANRHPANLVLDWDGQVWSGHILFDAYSHNEPLRDITFDPASGRVSFLRPGPSQHHMGTLSGDTLEGTFNQGGSDYRFEWSGTRIPPQPHSTGTPTAPLRAAVEGGEVEAMMRMARRHDDETSALHDPALALQWYRRAAEAGDPAGMLQTGLSLARGQGVARDDTAAVSWYRQAAERGNAEAMTMLGWMIADGRGTAHDDVAAMTWFRRAAEAGESLALNHIGVMYREGRAGPPDPAEALRWFTRAAQAGDPQGMMNLGQALARGSGTPTDPATAAHWLARALRADNSAVVDRVIEDAARLPQATLQALQRILQQAGIPLGAADGRFGPQTRQALERYAAGG